MSTWVKEKAPIKSLIIDESKLFDYLDIVNRYGAELYFPIKLEFYTDLVNNETTYRIVMLKAVGSRLSYEDELEDNNIEYKKILTLTSTDIDQLYKSIRTLLENLR